MEKRSLADYVQKENEPEKVGSEILNSALLELADVSVNLKQIKPGYSNQFSKTQSNQFQVFSQMKQARDHYLTEKYQLVPNDSKGVSPPWSDLREQYQIQDSVEGIHQQNTQALRALGEDLKIQRNLNSAHKHSLFLIQCNLNRSKVPKIQQTYSIFDQKRRQTSTLIGKCIQKSNKFRYLNEENAEVYQMEFKNEQYFFKTSMSEPQNIVVRFSNKSQSIKLKEEKQGRKSYEPKVLKTYINYDKKKFESRIQYNEKLKVLYIDSKDFSLKSSTPSMLNTVIFNPSDSEVCAVYEREEKIFVEIRTQEIPTYVLLMMAVSRIDFRRRCCIRQ